MKLPYFLTLLATLFSFSVSAPIETTVDHNNNVTSVRSIQYENSDGSRQISYITQGQADGPLLIFLHGWPGVAETWKHQLSYFADLGFYAVAPDMPGYGNSSAEANIADYAHENVIPGLLAMLEDTGRTKAIWVGHDWGAAVASSLVATHPEVVEAMAWLTVPYKTLELGYVEVLPLVNRTIYPEDEYPYGNWDYMVYYEEAYDHVTAVFNANISSSVRYVYSAWNGNISTLGTPGPLSHIRRDGGWFGGADQAPFVPLSATALDEELYNDVVTKINATGFGPADGWYMNHARNRAYNLEQQKNGGYLDIPCLYIQAKYDQILDTAVSNLLSPMPRYCKDFSFASVDAAHWLQLERPDDVNTAVITWLVQNVTTWL